MVKRLQMSATPPTEAQSAAFLLEVRRVLGVSMGIQTDSSLLSRLLPTRGVPVALVWLGVYSLVWAAIALWVASTDVTSQPKLVSLLAWGGCYYAIGIPLAYGATIRIMATVERDILCYASGDYVDAVADDLRQRHTPLMANTVPLIVAVASIAAGVWAVDQDIGILGLAGGASGRAPPVPAHSPELLLWALTFFVYFLGAARAVIAARFYLSFARCLDRDSAFFYVLNASETPLVKGLAKLGGQVLAFWASVFLLIISIMLLALLPGDYELAWSSRFLAVLIPIAGFFSFGFGTIVYLESEMRIRAVLRRFVQRHAALLQQRANAILNPAAGRVPDDPGALQRLADWHDRIIAGGHYGSRVRASLSLLLPFIPLVSLSQALYTWLSG